MNIFFVLLLCLEIIHYVSAKCSRGGMESFILSTNALPSPSSYKNIPGSSLVECTRTCLEDANCHSFIFLRNRNETECRLTTNILADSKKRQEPLLMPTLGTYYMEKLCLKGACDRLFVAESLRGMELDGYNDRIISNSSRLSCLESCLNNKAFVCKSVEFDSKTGECRLSRHDRFDRKSDFRKSLSASMEYFDVTCPYEQPSEGSAAEIVPLGNVEHPYSLVEYEGVTAEECGELCVRNVLFPCRSFLSGRLENQLYCGLTHINREGLVQNPGSLHLSRSLNYYEITRSIEGCDPSDIHFELVAGTSLGTDPYLMSSDLNPHECLEQCKKDRRCRSVSIDYKKGSCQYHSEGISAIADTKLQPNGNFNYFEKICFPGTQCKRDWSFERIRNKELVGIEHEKVLVEANTKEECQDACLNYKSFKCLSAEFNYQLSECRLSPYNRFSSTEKSVAVSNSRFVVDYFENNCFEEPRGFCNTKLIKKFKLLLTEKITTGESIEDCRQQCYDAEEFICRSVTYDRRFKTCGLSHHTRKSAPSESIARSDVHEFLEISTCFQVSVDCRQDIMMAYVRSNALFKGKVYAKGKPMTCSTDISNSVEFSLPISLNGPDCGTVSEEEGKFANVLVIQSNDHVVTAMDKAIGIHCSYDVGNKTEEIDLNITNPGSSDKTRGKPSLPDLSLHIVDMKGEERETVALGELLRVQVRMSDEDTYGIFVRNLVAKDGSGGNNLTLIDNTGCPVEVKMMREVRTIEPQSKSLEGYLEAFTFTGSSMLELEAEVETCLEHCKPVVCQIPTGRREDDTETVFSFGRKKRESGTEEVLSSVTLSRSIAIQADDFASVKSLVPENYASPVTAPSLLDLKGGSGLFHTFSSTTTNSDATFCFDPTMFALIAGGFFLVEVCGFSACLIAACRFRKNSKKMANKKRHLSIHYENSTEGS
ncbi:uncharacterized protein LOC129962605 [Argiope bruennichi]|uniref:uncharacterized protein LOC129962605 n=1 Tax=Argiope bruennichi TaxID=94029 RepID=UPI002495300A|nr:uncharacterized protein LOC129962605 [Argiope bruennichi]XP_055932528.1 uncharacterized protein LOC129962605 [Argiope bruennichi]